MTKEHSMEAAATPNRLSTESLDVNLKPMPAAEFTEVEIDDELVIYDHRMQKTQFLNTSASIIWSMCDGENTIEEISCQLADLYGLRVDEVSADSFEIICEMYNAGLLSLSR